MTRYFKVITTIAVAEDDGETEQRILDHVDDMFSFGELILLDSTIHEQTLVDSTWLQSVLPDDDDDDEVEAWWPEPNTPPTTGALANPPLVPRLDMTGVDPDSPQAEDIREAFIEATTPDPDDPA